MATVSADASTSIVSSSTPYPIIMTVLVWFTQLIVAIILAQTLYFKFTYAPETQSIFESRGGRPAATVTGMVELLCVVLLLIPRTAAIGAVLSFAVIAGALFFHLTSLGIQVKNPATGESDGGLLFGLAVAVAIGSVIVLTLRWQELPFVDSLRFPFVRSSRI